MCLFTTELLLQRVCYCVFVFIWFANEENVSLFFFFFFLGLFCCRCVITTTHSSSIYSLVYTQLCKVVALAGDMKHRQTRRPLFTLRAYLVAPPFRAHSCESSWQVVAGKTFPFRVVNYQRAWLYQDEHVTVFKRGGRRDEKGKNKGKLKK